MTFRLRIFLLVMLVTLTAIGATAFLTLDLTSREVTRAQAAAEQHKAEIVDAVERFGLTQGRWNGLNALVVRLSTQTNLHIRLNTADGDTLVDSDLERFGTDAGPVQAVPASVDPLPILSPSMLAGAKAARDAERLSLLKKLPSAGTTARPTDLFGPEPTDLTHTTANALALRQVAQYRAALVTVRCMAETKPGTTGAIPEIAAPYLTPELIKANPDCVRRATSEVLGDPDWMEQGARAFGQCVDPKVGVVPGCLTAAFREIVATTAAAPLELFLGAPADFDVSRLLGRTAAFGVAGLVLVALVGTALIARRVSDPVRRLTEASRLLADGEFDVRVPAGGRDELARLSASFNTMAGAVQRSEAQQRQLVADVAHEMRTPLSNLRGYLEGLSDGVIAPSRELFASLHDETLLQRRILDDLQVLALAENGELGYTKTPVDLAELVISGALVHRAVAAEAEIALTVQAPRPVWVDADPDRLRQVLGNLLTNAIRYTDRRGHVEARVRETAGTAVLTVQDTGVGIAAEDLQRVFDRFWRADPARQRATGGSGLGLTIVRRIVTDHAGTVDVTSTPGAGTTFTIRLPAGAALP
ncbi:MAG: two-component system, OmpR family, sensor histidine kinase BaeS [Actinoplanes sp.]|nr:two-component system, OmpR family, sensor histidine kinase BaeS [Actinoplanes sp.]